MHKPEHFLPDVLLFFDGRPAEHALFEALMTCMERAFPGGSVRVQRSQISFYNHRLFAAAALPLRRKRDWPRQCLLLTFGLGYRLPSPRIAVAVEPYPNRWTHHVVLSAPEQLDDELLGWLAEAYAFSAAKR